ncbi:hypothetical protein BSK59_13835 [Paenibacillus odorifer]|nr:hypothetical protein BSK59_13835 [Paenibacillus odorifer]
MVSLTPFQYKNPYSENTEEYTVYAVNCTNPEKRSGFMQGHFYCNYCGKGSFFRFYDESPYQCKCPRCEKEFTVEDDTDDEDY